MIDEKLWENPENREKITAYLLKKKSDILSKIPSVGDLESFVEKNYPDCDEDDIYDKAADLHGPFLSIEYSLERTKIPPFTIKAIHTLRKAEEYALRVDPNLRPKEIREALEELRNMVTYCYFVARQNGYVVSGTKMEWRDIDSRRGEWVVSDGEIKLQKDFLKIKPSDESELKRLVVPIIKERFKQIERDQETLKSIKDVLPYEVPNSPNTKDALEKERDSLYVKYKKLEEDAEIYPEFLKEIKKDIASIEVKINECGSSSRGLREIMNDCGLGHITTVNWGIFKELERYLREEHESIEFDRKILSDTLINHYKRSKPSAIGNSASLATEKPTTRLKTSTHYSSDVFNLSVSKAERCVAEILNLELKEEQAVKAESLQQEQGKAFTMRIS